MNIQPGTYPLADLMVDANLADDREEALELIAANSVRVNGDTFGMLDPVLNLTQDSVVITVGGNEVTVVPE